MTIVPITGHMIWNTDNVTPGDYSVQIITEDIETGLRVASEVKLRLLNSARTQPKFSHLSKSIPIDIIYTAPGNTVSTYFSVTDDDISDLSVVIITPTPKGVETDIISTNDTLTGNIAHY